MFVAKLLGESVGEEFLDLSGCDVSSLKASVLRKDYDEVTRSLLGKALDESSTPAATLDKACLATYS
jgi:hypothetical protein